MPRLNITIRDRSDIDDLADLEDLDQLHTPEAREREERREPSALAIERRQEGKRRGKEIARHLRQLEKLRRR